jgi:hypothetical protein
MFAFLTILSGCQFKMPINKRLGIGAFVNCFIKHLHPRADAESLFLNASSTDRILGCKVIGECTIKDGRKDIRACKLQHERFAGKELCAKLGACQMVTAGPTDLFFKVFEDDAAPGTCSG